MTKLSTFIFLILSISLTAQIPQINWQKTYGGSYYDKAESIIELNDGGYIVAGNSQSSNIDLSFNHGSYDWWVIKIGKTGNIIWKKTLGGTNYDYLRQIIKTPDGQLLCVGETQSNNGDVTNFIGQADSWVVKLDLSGNILWKKNFGGTGIDRAFSACITEDGNIIIANTTESGMPYVTNSYGISDIWLLKIDLQGNIIWQKSFGGSGDDFVKSIKPTIDNGYIIIGNSLSSNGILNENKGELDVWILKTDSNGQLLWQKTFGGSKSDYANALIEDKNGDFLIVGETYSFDFDASENHSDAISRDYFVLKINTQGQKIWSRCYGGSGNEYARGVVETFGREYVIVGESYSNDGQAPNSKGSADFWLIKINPTNGDLIWQKKYGSDGHDEPNTMILTFDNDFMVVGNTFPVSDLGDVGQKYGDDDMWVIRFSNNECVKNIIVSEDMQWGNRIYNATDIISTNKKILNAESNIIYSAGKSILLEKGFSTQNGATFQAKIEGCN